MKIIYNLFRNLCLILSYAGCAINFPFLSALSIFLMTRKINLKYKKNTKQNFILLYRSGGVQDFTEIFKNTINDKKFYILERINLKIIYKFFFLKKYSINKYNRNESIIINSNNYKKYVLKVIKWLKFFLKDFSFVSFSLFYYEDIIFREQAKKIGLKNYLLYKECFRSPIEQKIYFENRYYKYLNFFDKIAVYNNDTKNYLLNNSLLPPDRISVIGCGRTLKLINKKKIVREKIKNILLFQIENKKGIPMIARGRDIKYKYKINQQSIRNSNWSHTSSKIYKLFFKFANEYKNINFIIKIKNERKIPKNLKFHGAKYKNVKIINLGLGDKLIKKSQIVIGLNSAATIEAKLARKILMIPFFEKNKSLYKNFIYTYSKNDLYSNEKIFYNKLKKYLSKKYLTNNNNNITNDYIIKKYLGDLKTSKQKMIKFFN